MAKTEIIATLSPLHPGEVLREEFMVPHRLTAYAVAKACHIPRTRIERIAREELGISGDTALRLGKLFGVDPQFWLNLQSRYEIETAKLAAGAALNEIVPLAA
jgi:addiction module HigA family antidote